MDFFSNYRTVADYLTKQELSISYSLIKQFESCPRRAFFSMTIPFWRKPGQNEANFIAGSVVHDLVFNWANNDYQDGYLESNCDVYWQKHETNAKRLYWRTKLAKQANEWGVTSDREYNYQKVVRSLPALYQFVDDFDWRDGKPFVERRFKKQWGDNIVFKGFVDVLEQDLSTIYDFKVTFSRYGHDILQMYFYALLVNWETGEFPNYGYFLFPLLPEEKRIKQINITYSDAKNEFTDRITPILQAVKSGCFPAIPKTSNSCFNCRYTSMCSFQGGGWNP